MSYKKWVVADADKDTASVLSEKLNIDPFIAFLLVTRGIKDELTASEFISDSCRFVSPLSFKDMDKAVSRINSALDNCEKICVFGDYDCDGVTATALLVNFLESLGADVFYYIPDRITDGYGMNFKAIDYIKECGTKLIITVDNGISAFDEAKYIYSLGMELVVTDHHQIDKRLPEAEAVVNPHREDNDLTFKSYSGVGVAFKLACALYDGDVDEMIEQYADLVAIGTIGDVVSLKSENRELVKAGLRLISDNSRIGVCALKSVAGCDNNVSAGAVAFQLCPRINAAGRMDRASIAVELLLSDDYEDARFKAEQLNTENTHRHEVENNIIKALDGQIAKNPFLIQDRVIVLAGDGFHKGVVGICAAHIAEKYGKPAIVLGIDENGEATGSARSIEGFNIFDAIMSCRSLLSHFGGHPLAAGLGLNADDIDEFRLQINNFAELNYPVMPVQTLNIDCKLSPFYLNTDLVESLELLEPYGADNLQPIFGLYNFTLMSVTPIGEGRHVRLEITKKNKAVRVVKFKTTVDDIPYKVGDNIDLAVKLSENFYKGKKFLSVQAVDIRKSGIDYDRYFNEKSQYELFKLGKLDSAVVYPDRDACSYIYRFLKQNNGWNFSIDDLYFELCSKITYGQLNYALEAFIQSGLITLNDSVVLNKVTEKKDLEGTDILKSLKGRLKID